MKVQGVLDRIVDHKYGTILVEDLGKEFTLKIEEFPPGTQEGDWLDLTIQEDQITNISVNQEKTEAVKSDLQKRMEKLRKKSSSRFKRK